MKLEFTNDTDLDIHAKLFEDLLPHLPKTEAETVELLLTDDETIRELNKKYRKIDKPTDVLSFEMGAENLGQIVISVERAIQQAKELKQSLEKELRFLFTHGLLHLLGYDHENPEDERKMLEKAYEILGR